MFDPLAYPYQRAQNYADGADPKVLSNDFYNPTQDSLARLFGAATGLSTSIVTEDFDRQQALVTPVVGDAFGRQLSVNIVNNTKVASADPVGAGDHGLWKAQCDAGGAYDFVALDSSCQIGGTAQFIWTAKVRVTGRANLNVIDPGGGVDGGIVVGMSGVSTAHPSFRGGSDQANWQFFDGAALADTGVALADGPWYWLIIARKAGVLAWYIKSGAGALTLISSEVFGGVVSPVRRYLAVHGGGGAMAADGVTIDFFSRGVER